MKRVEKRRVTLIEMMIVMFLIMLIMGVIAYNYRGSLEQGKAFKSKIGIEKLETILSLAVAENPALLDSIETRWPQVIERSPLVHDVNSLIYDGWGEQYDVKVEDGQIYVFSEKYDNYQKAHGALEK